MKLVFASDNKNKLLEIQQLLPKDFELAGLNEIGCKEKLPETQPTLEGNAAQKASYIYNNFQINCFADDTGLEVEALNGAPGVYSARYAGEEKSSQRNIEKLLAELNRCANRKAQFRTVICLIMNGQKYLFEGIAKGEILQQQVGSNGFGYDPVFKPEGFNHSFAEMDLTEKNKISHRALAMQKLLVFLNRYPLK